ncbi:MAG: cob(I)yrinic acid a,c-diamide adenosyltransferase [Candidatus Omnitrophica bacterium]|nr:cob(I)yrinic acid a,c-diamide adenosyltransferase [Candidatus Omnitrophota bacterium]
MKKNTGRGDKGKTDVLGGGRVFKDSARIEAVGALDELNAALGLARAAIKQQKIKKELEGIQKTLFLAGKDVVSGAQKKCALDAGATKRLEAFIAKHEAALPHQTKQFIIPGKTTADAFLHLARTVARRAERRAVTLLRRKAVNPEVCRYLNRLSDYLFLTALVWRECL